MKTVVYKGIVFGVLSREEINIRTIALSKGERVERADLKIIAESTEAGMTWIDEHPEYLKN